MAILIPYFLIILPRGNIYIENSRGPRTDPCVLHTLLVIIEMTPRLNNKVVAIVQVFNLKIMKINYDTLEKR